MTKQTNLKSAKALIPNTPLFLFVTATDIETGALHEQMRPINGEGSLVLCAIENNSYYLGKIGKYGIVHLQLDDMGAMATGGVITTVIEAINEWSPDAVIMVGIAFGRDSKKQKIGDVLIAKTVVNYERARISSSETISRAPETECGIVLLNRFLNIPGWSFKTGKTRVAKKHVGLLLSGEKLVDNEQFKKNLVKDYRASIGGDMEAFGLYVAAKRRGVSEWLVVKSICDWGDGNKFQQKKFRQSQAAKAAVSLCRCVLEANTLDDLPRNPKRPGYYQSEPLKRSDATQGIVGSSLLSTSLSAINHGDESYEQLVTFFPVNLNFQGIGNVSAIIHAGPINQIVDVDVIVASENTHFELARPFKSSTSGRLRNAAAQKDEKGKVLDDVLYGELEAWRIDSNFGNTEVAEGTVISTSSGQMIEQGVSRIYHAAVVSPIQGVHGYTVKQETIEFASIEVIALLKREQDRGIIPKPCSICLPLLGTGRGKLEPKIAFQAMMRGLSTGIEQYRPQVSSIHFCTMMRHETNTLLKALKRV
jgi:nucleoside phosphorylase